MQKSNELRLLKPADQQAVLSHLVGLSSDDRYTRFRRVMSDTALQKYVESVDLKRHIAVGQFVDSTLAGFALMSLYVCREGYLTGELSVSVLDNYRRLGIATAVMLGYLVAHMHAPYLA